MRRLLGVVLLLTATLSVSATDNKTAEPLRVVSFNVRLRDHYEAMAQTAKQARTRRGHRDAR